MYLGYNTWENYLWHSTKTDVSCLLADSVTKHVEKNVARNCVVKVNQLEMALVVNKEQMSYYVQCFSDNIYACQFYTIIQVLNDRSHKISKSFQNYQDNKHTYQNVRTICSTIKFKVLCDCVCHCCIKIVALAMASRTNQNSYTFLKSIFKKLYEYVWLHKGYVLLRLSPMSRFFKVQRLTLKKANHPRNHIRKTLLQGAPGNVKAYRIGKQPWRVFSWEPIR